MAGRLHFIDALKALGIFMFIIWHVFENFYGYAPVSSSLFRSVICVTGYFVFSSGFMIGFHYYNDKKYRINWLWNRLGVRAAKLILIALTAGMVMTFLQNRQFNADLFTPLMNIISLFYTDRWDIPLQVLLAIGCTLIWGMICLRLRQTWILGLVHLVVLGALFSWELLLNNRLPYLWRYVFQGYIGIFIGLFFINHVMVQESEKKQSTILLMAVSLSVFFFMEILVILDPKTYYIFLFDTILQAIMIASFFVGFSLLFRELLDTKRNDGILRVIRPFLLLGKHSLFVYLIQIIIINLILIVHPLKILSSVECMTISIILFFICFAVTIGLDWLLRFTMIKSFYSAVFR